MSTRGSPLAATGSGQYKRKLNGLGFTLTAATIAAKPSGSQLAELQAPQKFHVCVLGKDDFIAVTKLRSCTGLALYDAASKVGAMYHFGGQFNNEQATLDKFAEELRDKNVEFGKLQMWLFGSTKCGFADKLMDQLNRLGFMQSPIVYEVDGQSQPEAAFYLLGSGVVAHQLT